ncbi:unnamed protein product [Prorocentrum cordatum]|uniref:Uncharacterized protein n=1 Tax=Prorocentrum cordatum TaxID=2364126 RepID=A0ABN9PLW3_9DINO|nr:unnamed protein product [Polarella glacialis]
MLDALCGAAAPRDPQAGALAGPASLPSAGAADAAAPDEAQLPGMGVISEVPVPGHSAEALPSAAQAGEPAAGHGAAGDSAVQAWCRRHGLPEELARRLQDEEVDEPRQLTDLSAADLDGLCAGLKLGYKARLIGVCGALLLGALAAMAVAYSGWAAAVRPGPLEACSLQEAPRADTSYALGGCGCAAPSSSEPPRPSGDEEGEAAGQVFLVLLLVLAGLVVVVFLYRSFRRAAIMRDIYRDDTAEFHVFTDDECVG